MAESVVLRLRDHTAETVEWIVVDDSGGLVSAPQTGDLAAIAEAAAGKKVVACVPASHVLRATANVPVRSTSKLLQALPFAMEEQLAEDVDKSHFAVGKRQQDGLLPVAVVQCVRMDEWLEQFSTAGIELTGLYADGDLVGDIPGTTILLVEPDSVMLRDTDGSIAVADRNGLEVLINLWLAGLQNGGDSDDVDQAVAPVNLLVYSTPGVGENLDSVLDWIRPFVETLERKVLSDGALPRMASQAVVKPGINLLQGAYASRSNFATYIPAWRLAAMLLAGLMVAIVSVKVLEIAQLNSQADALDIAIEQAFRYTFPEVRELRDPRAQLRSKLSELGSDMSGAGEGQFLDTLRAVSVAVSQASKDKVKFEAINYRSGVMELRVIAPDVEALDNIQKEIAKHGGLTTEIQSANPEGDKILGRLQIKRSEV